MKTLRISALAIAIVLAGCHNTDGLRATPEQVAEFCEHAAHGAVLPEATERHCRDYFKEKYGVKLPSVVTVDLEPSEFKPSAVMS